MAANVSYRQLIASGDPRSAAGSESFIQSQLKEAGINVDIKPETFPAHC